MDADAKDKEGLSSLMKAASCGHARIVRLLLKKVNIETSDTEGATALQMAVDGQHEAVI